MTFYVRFWGTRGSIPTPGRRTRVYGGNTSCVEIRYEDALFICDAGTGARELGQSLLKRFDGPIVGHIFFSHSHWDHIQGFPFFTPAYLEANTFYVYSPHIGDTKMYDLLSGQMRSEYFPVNFADLGAHIVASDLADSNRVIEGVKVSFLEQDHPGGSYAFKFESQGNTLVYATDTELDAILTNRDETLVDFQAIRRFPKEYIEFAQGADLLICDSQYFDDEYPEKEGWGHPRANTAADWAVQANVKHLVLFHHDPMHSDKDVEEKVAMCRTRVESYGATTIVSAAREGLEFRVVTENRDA